MAQVSGKNAKIRFGGGSYASVQRGKKWTLNYKTQDQDITSAESAGAGTYIFGILDGDVTIEGDYYVADSPTLLAGWGPGVTADAKLYLNDTAGPFWLANILVTSCETTAEVRGLVGFKITGKTTGPVTVPVT